jgi:hypothetical protein
MQLQEIIDTVKMNVVSGRDFSRDVQYAYISDILSDVMAKSPKAALWITNQVHENIVAIAFFKGLAGIILPEGNLPEAAILTKAQHKNIPIFSSQQAAFDIAGQLYALGLRGRL